jgi:hypothetical protein
LQDKHVGGLLHCGDDIVQLGGERVDILTVKRGDEGGVEPGQDGVGDAVAFVLILDQAFGFQLRVDEVFEEVVQQPGGLAMVSAAASKRLKRTRRGDVSQLHRASPPGEG